MEQIVNNMDIVIVGHVDHGKSTIIGKLLADTGSLPEGKLEQVKETCRRNSKPFEYAFLLDALKDEQAQGITIDVARCFFKTPKRKYTIIDAPGHIEFLRNMVTGASRAEAALLVIDAGEGIKENSRRHGYMLSMLGIKQVTVLVNKMDLIEYSEEKYKNIVIEFSEFLRKVDIIPASFIPVSGTEGDNIVATSCQMDWYKGNTVLEELDKFIANEIPENKPFRMHVQGVYKFTKGGDNRRIVAGTIDSGVLKVGDEVIFYPSEEKSKVKTIEIFNKDSCSQIGVGNAVGFTLEEQIFVSRGDLVTIAEQSKPRISARVKVNLFWLGKQPMIKNKEYFFKLGTAKVKATLESIIRVIDASSLDSVEKEQIDRNEVADCIIKLDREIALDQDSELQQTNRFVLVDGYEISGGGIILQDLDEKHDLEIQKKTNLFISNGKVQYDDRCRLLKQQGIVVWFTGLSGAGKTTIAIELERKLFEKGNLVYRLDGDNIRHGLNSDLGFSKNDRIENIRRIAEVAALFTDAGYITLVSFISPYKEMRKLAKAINKKCDFLEIYVKCNINICAARDTKGLYKKALTGEIDEFTGLTSDYEEPENPDLIINTENLSVENAVKLVEELIRDKIIVPEV